MAVIDITCATCNDVFGFTDEEQSFYAERGFSQPRKCKPCRAEAKQQRQGGGGGRPGGFGGGAPRGPRELFDAVCAACGIQTQVPFKPNGQKPVYCRACFQ
jgi:CxxC-x17-CxxC domain-containing protein